MRIVGAAVMDFVRSVEESAFQRMREAARGDAPRIPEEPPSPTLAELGCPFPLMEAPSGDAEIDDAGPCCICRREAALRFERACYTCFRSKKGGRAVDTENG